MTPPVRTFCYSLITWLWLPSIVQAQNNASQPVSGQGTDKEESTEVEPKESELVTLQYSFYQNRTVRMERSAAAAYEQLLAQARKDGFKEPLFLIISGFRSNVEHQKLWQEAKEKYGDHAAKWVASARSIHSTGKAMDLYLGAAASSNNVSTIRRSAAYAWLVQNASRYGFSGYQPEPWHWKYSTEKK